MVYQLLVIHPAAVSGSSSGRDNAGGQYIDLTGDLDTSYQEITIEVYVNIDSTTGKEVDNAGIFHFGVDDRDEMFKLYTNYGSKDYINMIAQYNENSSTSITQFTTSSLIQNLCDGNTYMHLVYTCNGPTMTVYLNGASFLTATNNSFSFGSATRSLCELGRSSDTHHLEVLFLQPINIVVYIILLYLPLKQQPFTIIETQ